MAGTHTYAWLRRFQQTMPGQGHKRWRTSAHLNSRHPAYKPETGSDSSPDCPMPSVQSCVVSSGTAPLRRLKMAPVAARVTCEAGLNWTMGGPRAVWVIERRMILQTDTVVCSCPATHPATPWFSVILNSLSSSSLSIRVLTLFLTDAHRA
ncbi:hypothetical protein CDEST_13755 [Colletotrichum destructivum]|uniref:Uncharacterized protein n=1 Tax=Colletotrichum destructivum TaxID=34406 RepID=A0AAX4IZX6_9PEZI|nr:hypothetical protein CDEST_13755 [Colletotrichum destructivum]